MQWYFKHLLEDIAAAKRSRVNEYGQVRAAGEYKNVDEYFREVELYLDSYPQLPLSYYCGLHKEQLPPPERLSESQMEDICVALRKMYLTWKIEAHLHIIVPVSKLYCLLVSVLDEKVNVGLDGHTTIEFCNYHPPSCNMNEYCTCRDFYEKEYPRHNGQKSTD